MEAMTASMRFNGMHGNRTDQPYSHGIGNVGSDRMKHGARRYSPGETDRTMRGQVSWAMNTVLSVGRTGSVQPVRAVRVSRPWSSMRYNSAMCRSERASLDELMVGEPQEYRGFMALRHAGQEALEAAEGIVPAGRVCHPRPSEKTEDAARGVVPDELLTPVVVTPDLCQGLVVENWDLQGLGEFESGLTISRQSVTDLLTIQRACV